MIDERFAELEGDPISGELTATAIKPVTLPNNAEGFTNHSKGTKVTLTREDAVNAFGEKEILKMEKSLEKEKQSLEVKEVFQAEDGKYYSRA